MANGLANTHRRHVREKSVIDHVARKLFEPKREPAAENSYRTPEPDDGDRIVGRGANPQGVGPEQGRAADISDLDHRRSEPGSGGDRGDRNQAGSGERVFRAAPRQ